MQFSEDYLRCVGAGIAASACGKRRGTCRVFSERRSQSCIGMKRSWDPYPGWWEKRHQEKLAQIAASGGEIDLVFIGDSITHNREGARGPGSAHGGKPLAELKKKYSVLNLGFGGATGAYLQEGVWKVTSVTGSLLLTLDRQQ